MKSKILLFGGSGLIGSRVIGLLGRKYKIYAPSHLEVDVVNKLDTQKAILMLKPDYIIYAAGVTSVDIAEQDPKSAYLLNTEVPGFIAKVAAFLKIPLLYFSTDAVFDGTNNKKPYLEDDKTNPLSEYGKSKLLGEQIVMNTSNNSCIIRVIQVYSHIFFKRRRFVQIAIETLRKGEKFYGIVDQIANPIYVDDIVFAVDLLIQSKSCGIYHLGATDYVSNFEFVMKLAEHLDLNKNLVAQVSFDEFFKNKLARRSKYCWLDTSKFRSRFGSNILHSVDEGIKLLKMNSNL